MALARLDSGDACLGLQGDHVHAPVIRRGEQPTMAAAEGCTLAPSWCRHRHAHERGALASGSLAPRWRLPYSIAGSRLGPVRQCPKTGVGSGKLKGGAHGPAM